MTSHLTVVPAAPPAAPEPLRFEAVQPPAAPPTAIHGVGPVKLWYAVHVAIDLRGYDPSTDAIQVVWRATGEILHWRFASLERDARHHIGSLSGWAFTLVPEYANGKPLVGADDLLAVLKHSVPGARSTETSAPGAAEDAQDPAARLLMAALTGPIYAEHQRTTALGTRGKIHGHAGIGLMPDGDEWVAYLRLPSVLIGPLLDGEFGPRWGRKTVKALAEILRRSDRLITDHAGNKSVRDLGGRWWAARATDLVAVPATFPATSATSATGLAERGAGVAGVADQSSPPDFIRASEPPPVLLF